MSNRKSPVPIALWNPLWIVIWSYIFSPAFGSYLQRANWNEMGNYTQAEKSGNWFYASLIVLAILLFAEPFIPEEAPLNDFWFIIIWTIWYLIWSLTNGAAQIKQVERIYGKNYHHKLWGHPLIIGACGLILWMALSLTYVIALLLAGIITVTP